MKRQSLQFGISTLMWWVLVAAVHCWLFSVGAWGIIVALVVDKHILVAYLCWATQVDRKGRSADRPGIVQRSARAA